MKAFTAAGVALIVTLSACGADDSESVGTIVESVAATPAVTAAAEASAPTVPAAQATAPPTTDVAATVTNSPASTAPDSPTPSTMAPVELAAWQMLPITDVDGVTFTLGEYVGRPLLIEPFATWCSKCRAQLGDTNQVASELGDEAAVVALSVETDLSPDDVASYRADNDFQHIRFAIMSPELLAAMADAFGTSVANPPSTPKIIVDALGQAGELKTGPQSIEDLVAGLRAASV